MRTRHDDASLLAEVEPTVARLLDRHIGVAKEWFPHEYIPYSLGRDYDKEPWTPDQPRLTGVAQTAFEVNLLTEDNLPSYHRLIHKMFSKGDGAWKNWINRWTAEEGRHAIVIRDYLVVTRNIDPVALERGRMQNVMPGSAIAGFTRKAARMADAGIYDLRIHHDDILWPLLRYWRIFERTGLDAQAEHDRGRLHRFLDKLDASARTYEERRAARHEREGSAAK